MPRSALIFSSKTEVRFHTEMSAEYLSQTQKPVFILWKETAVLKFSVNSQREQNSLQLIRVPIVHSEYGWHNSPTKWWTHCSTKTDWKHKVKQISWYRIPDV